MANSGNFSSLGQGCPIINLDFGSLNCTDLHSTRPCNTVERCFATPECAAQEPMAIDTQVSSAVCTDLNSAQKFYCHCTLTLDNLQIEPKSAILNQFSDVIGSNITAISPGPVTVSTQPISSSVQPTQSGGLSGGEIAGIVVGVLLFLIVLLIFSIFLLRRIKERRKNRGCYQPQEEEQKNYAKNLPPLPDRKSVV